jgi:hypothetical protein
MPSDRPRETKEQIVARHRAELEESGHGISLIKKWGGVAGAIMAIGVLLAALGNQFWPWCVKVGMSDEQKTLPQVVSDLNESVKALNATLKATIEAAGEHVHEQDLTAQKLGDSIEALRNEVRLRHGAYDIAAVLNNYGAGSGRSGRRSGSARGGGSGSGSGQASRAPAAAAPRPPRLTRRQQIDAVVQHADATLHEAKTAKKPAKGKFNKAVQAKLAK